MNKKKIYTIKRDRRKREKVRSTQRDKNKEKQMFEKQILHVSQRKKLKCEM